MRGDAKRTRRNLYLTLRDDGMGFAPSIPKGFGLMTMTERVASLGGSCVIESVPMKGTTIRIDLPIQRSKAKRARIAELVERLAVVAGWRHPAAVSQRSFALTNGTRHPF